MLALKIKCRHWFYFKICSVLKLEHLCHNPVNGRARRRLMLSVQIANECDIEALFVIICICLILVF